MRDDGIAVASIVVDSKLRLVCSPMVALPGLLDPIEDSDFISEIKQGIIDAVADQRKQSKSGLSTDQIESCVAKTLRRMIKHEINKSPNIIVNLEEIE
jgi:ribonuclease J